MRIYIRVRVLLCKRACTFMTIVRIPKKAGKETRVKRRSKNEALKSNTEALRESNLSKE